MTEIDEQQNLSHLFGAARDQWSRPTCLAFAASDAHAGLRESWVPLSCEFVFYHAQRRAGRSPNVGATLPTILDALRHDGQPCEEGWPYLPALPADEASWQPPHDVGEVYRRAGEQGQNTVEEIIAELDQGRPVLVLMYLSMSFDLAGPDGLVDPPAEELPDFARRHAVVAIGHGTYKGRRVILARNSWGEEWGQDGHAWLTEELLRPRVFRVAILTEEIDVAPRAATA